MSIKKITLITLVAFLLLPFSGCDKKHITYVQMVKREKAEINKFIDDSGFKIVDHFSKDEAMKDKVFVKILDGVYMHVYHFGTPLPKKYQRMLCRFQVRSIVPDRLKFSEDIISPNTAGGTYPVAFLFSPDKDVLLKDPQANVDESGNFSIICPSIMAALKYVGDGSEIALITSFREGPNFTAAKGVPLYFERLSFTFNKN